MDFNNINNNIKQQIKHKLGVDVNKTNRQRENVEARVLYYTILKELTPSQSLKEIGGSIGKHHTSVIHSLKQYDSYAFYNKKLDKVKKKDY